MKILFLEPFFGGSHRDFALGLQAHSRHRIDLVTLPPRFWKWRMRGATLALLPKMPALAPYDLIVATNLLSLADLRALIRQPAPPLLAYFHENQLSYPLAPGEPPDVHFGFTDITSALAADHVWFNSHSHREAFLNALPGFLKQMPDARPSWVVEALRGKSTVMHPGGRLPPHQDRAAVLAAKPMAPPLIIWNHRWEFDKQPEVFFDAMQTLAQRGLDFELAVLGERFKRCPACFANARQRLGDRIVQFGYVPSATTYRNWLRRGRIVVSTAIQENFGLAVVEAVHFGCLPLLPRRLSYPEIIPAPFHDLCLYDSTADLIQRLARLLKGWPEAWQPLPSLMEAMGAYAWEQRGAVFDRAFARCLKASPPPADQTKRVDL